MGESNGTKSKAYRRKQMRDTMRRYRARHPERVKEARKRLYINRKVRAMKLVSDARCEKCGCDELDYLEYNHKGGGGAKEFREYYKQNGNYLGMTDLLLSGKRKPDGLEILCRVCNAVEFLERKNNNHAGRYNIQWI